METQTAQTIEQQPINNNPLALEMIAEASNAPDSLQLFITDIGDEQCVVAEVTSLNDDMKAMFDSAVGISDDIEQLNNWRDWEHQVAQLGGVEDTGVQAVFTGQTGRKKTIQVALFGIENGEQLMQTVAELNDLRRDRGVEMQEGIPEQYAYLPDNILVATREMRENSVQEIRAISEEQEAAMRSGAVALGGVQSKVLGK